MAKELNITRAAVPPTSNTSKITEVREACGLTKKAVSDRLGIPYRTIQNYELGERKIPDWLIDMICREIKRVAAAEVEKI
jgi:DNA-binding transcriptional regulator YiaG